MKKFSFKNIFFNRGSEKSENTFNEKLSQTINIIKKNAFFYSTCGISILLFCALIFVAYGKIQDQIQPQEKIYSRTIVLDPGHGQEDGGAVGVDGIVEKDVNLSVALKLNDFLEASGYNVIMTRSKDEAIYDDNAKTLREKKISDIKNRSKIVEENTKDGSIFVSIHQNKFPDPQYFGTQIFYSTNNPKSQELANSVKESIVGLIQPENTRELKPADKKVYLLHHAKLPAIIIECGFLSNEAEARKLASEEYQKQLAFCGFCGITNYFINNA